MNWTEQDLANRGTAPPLPRNANLGPQSSVKARGRIKPPKGRNKVVR